MFVFFFKQKTAYEMRISDWSADVCSSDLVVAGQRIELDADRQATLQLGQHVRGLGHVESTRGNEQHVVRAHRPMLGGHRGALDEWQQVALNALARDVGAAALGARGDLVDLVQEDDAVLLDSGDRGADYRLLVEQRSEEHTSELQSLMRI